MFKWIDVDVLMEVSVCGEVMGGGGGLDLLMDIDKGLYHLCQGRLAPGLVEFKPMIF